MSQQSIARFDQLVSSFLQVEEAGSAQRTLADVCLRVAEPEANLRERNLLPTYDCLVLSPSNIWQGQQEVQYLRISLSTFRCSMQAFLKNDS